MRDGSCLHVSDTRVVNLRVVTTTRGTMSIRVPISIGIATLKERVSVISGVAVKDLTLTYGHRILMTLYTLSTYIVLNDETIH